MILAKLDDIIEKALRSTYGATDPHYSASVRGGGAGQGMRGGSRGKPGYPVPDNLKEDEGGTTVYRGLRGLTPQKIAKLTGKNAGSGEAEIDWEDTKGYWTTNPKIAMTYATTSAVKEKGGNILAIVRGTTQAKPVGSMGAVNPGNPVKANKIWWTDRDSELKSANLHEGVDQKQGLEVMHANADKLAKRGIKVPPNAHPLGTGTQGTAYDLGGGRVLKVTDDHNEAIAALKLKGKSYKRLAKIFDVFRFKDGPYGILQEKLSPLNPQEKKEFDEALILTAVTSGIKRFHTWEKGVEDVYSWRIPDLMKRMKLSYDDPKAKSLHQQVDAALDLLEKKYGLPEINKELLSAGIQFYDYQAANLMKRGSDYILIDTGLSKVEGGAEPDVLEGKEPHIFEALSNGIMRSMVAKPAKRSRLGERIIQEVIGALNEEQKADTVAVTVDTYQPPSKGLVAAVRQLATKFTKVVVIIDGKGGQNGQPFSFDTRKNVLMMSLPDVAKKVEVYQGTSTDLPGTIDRIIKDHNSSVEADVAINIMVPPQVLAATQQQVQAAHERKKLGQILFDPSLAKVGAIQGYTDDSKQLMAALQKGDKKAAAKFMDPHLVGNEDDFRKAYVEMRDEMKESQPVEEKLEEDLASEGGEAGIMQVLQQNADLLMQKKGIDVGKLKALGHGKMGVAYLMANGKVIKVTTDDREAKSSFLIQNKGRGLSNVVKVDDVFQFKGRDVFGIVQEKLEPLQGTRQTEKGVTSDPGTEAGDFDALAKLLTGDDIIMALATEDYDDILFRIKHHFEEANGLVNPKEVPAQAPTGNFAGTAPARKGALNPQQKAQASAANAEKDYQKTVAEMKRFNMDKIIPQLRRLGIQFADFHSGNLMKRGGQYVIADLGVSQSRGPMPPVLEGIVKKIIEDMGGYTGGAMYGRGGATCGPKGGSSPWSSPMDMMTDDDVEDENPEEHLWQKQLTQLQPIGRHKADVYNK